ncbi:molecular chaperone DnaK [Algoriphagus lutimaris]|uniref:molecular chaperone DnaK n=1 Tax=Algoriphagus lutimaris TaxID=613197 RepID=UPI001FAF52E7|nr:molecular chaperone DnaK [Algoriphagus lutimaris]
MKAKYEKEVKKGNAKDKTDQEPKVGGIQFYFTEYTEKTAKEIYPGNHAEYTGQMTLVMRPANLKDNQVVYLELVGNDGDYVNGTSQCPYRCEPDPTNS